MPARSNALEETLRGDAIPFRWIVENLEDAVGILDPDATIAYLSPAVERLVGRKPCELLGRHAFEHIHPDDHAHVADVIRATFQTPGASNETEYRYRHKDGSWRHFHARGTCIPLGDGSVGLMFVTHDVTERRRAEEAQRLVSAIVESSHDAVVTTDANGVITSWSPGAERLFGFRACDVLGASSVPMIPPDLLPETLRLVEPVLRGTCLQDFETERLHQDGSRIPVSMSVFPLRDADGRSFGIAAIVRDLRDRRLAERTAEAQAAMRGVFRRTLRAGQEGSMRQTGRRLAREIGPSTSLEEVAERFADLGLGDLRLVESDGGRHVFEGRDLLERVPRAAQPTCSLPLGFLEAACGLLAGGEGLGAELECQSLGHACCRFVVRVRAAPGAASAPSREAPGAA